MESEEARMLEKVRRLFELAKSNNEFESAAAAAKAQELMYKYGLTQGQLKSEDRLPIVKVEITLTGGDRAWMGRLMNCLSKSNGAYLVHLDNENYAIMGQRPVIEVTVYSFQQMRNRMMWLAQTAWDIYDGDEREVVYKQGYVLGAIQALTRVLEAQRAHQQSQETESTTALVVSNDRALELAVHGFFPRLTTRRGPSIGSVDGYGSGKRAGSHLQVNPGLYAGKGQRRLG